MTMRIPAAEIWGDLDAPFWARAAARFGHAGAYAFWVWGSPGRDRCSSRDEVLFVVRADDRVVCCTDGRVVDLRSGGMVRVRAGVPYRLVARYPAQVLLFSVEPLYGASFDDGSSVAPGFYIGGFVTADLGGRVFNSFDVSLLDDGIQFRRLRLGAGASRGEVAVYSTLLVVWRGWLELRVGEQGAGRLSALSLRPGDIAVLTPGTVWSVSASTPATLLVAEACGKSSSVGGDP